MMQLNLLKFLDKDFVDVAAKANTWKSLSQLQLQLNKDLQMNQRKIGQSTEKFPQIICCTVKEQMCTRENGLQDNLLSENLSRHYAEHELTPTLLIQITKKEIWLSIINILVSEASN